MATATQRVHFGHVRSVRELGLERQLSLRSAMRRSSRHRGTRRMEGKIRIQTDEDAEGLRERTLRKKLYRSVNVVKFSFKVTRRKRRRRHL